MTACPLISVGIPVRNGAAAVGDTIRSVLAQDYGNLEVVISDNASTDETEDVIRELAANDARIVYQRQESNIGLLRNFSATIDSAQGEFFRWLGHHDRLAPTYLSRCADVLRHDGRLVLVTSQIEYELDDGSVETTPYNRNALGADDPVTRFVEMMRLLTESYQLLDPLYSLMRRGRVQALPRRNLLAEDEILAAELALLGPWGHVPEVLAFRSWSSGDQRSTARVVDAPLWHIPIAREVESFHLLRMLADHGLSGNALRRARRAVVGMHVRRSMRRISNRISRVRMPSSISRWSSIAINGS